jgi:5-methylcytosine-specific restriction protein B
MARQINQRDLSPILAAARAWISDSLVGDRSVFGSGLLWSSELIEEVTRAFVDHPDIGDDPFMVKLSRQVGNCSPGAKQLLAEVLWAMFLFPSNMRATTKREQIAEAWSWSGASLDVSHRLLGDEVLAGVGSAGQAYHSLRYRELAFVLSVLKSVKELDPAERVTVFSDYDAFIVWIARVPQEGNRQFRHMLRYFSFPDRVERMASNRERRQVLEGFNVASSAELKKRSDAELDSDLANLRQRWSRNTRARRWTFTSPRWRRSGVSRSSQNRTMKRMRRTLRPTTTTTGSESRRARSFSHQMHSSQSIVSSMDRRARERRIGFD